LGPAAERAGVKLLLGIGGSNDSLRALSATVERARAAGDELVVAVVENPDSPRDPDEVVARAREAVAAAGLDATVRRVEGDPGPQLVEIAETEGFDRIVLGGGETSPMGKINPGRIAEFVALNAPVTVTLVR